MPTTFITRPPPFLHIFRASYGPGHTYQKLNRILIESVATIYLRMKSQVYFEKEMDLHIL